MTISELMTYFKQQYMILTKNEMKMYDHISKMFEICYDNNIKLDVK